MQLAAFALMCALIKKPKNIGENMFITILLIAAFILFVIAAFPVASRINLVAAGLACWVLSGIVSSGLLK
jgi:hypothetical protein